jgi:hypothetical protein
MTTEEKYVVLNSLYIASDLQFRLVVKAINLGLATLARAHAVNLVRAVYAAKILEKEIPHYATSQVLPSVSLRSTV